MVIASWIKSSKSIYEPPSTSRLGLRGIKRSKKERRIVWSHMVTKTNLIARGCATKDLIGIENAVDLGPDPKRTIASIDTNERRASQTMMAATSEKKKGHLREVKISISHITGMIGDVISTHEADHQVSECV